MYIRIYVHACHVDSLGSPPSPICDSSSCALPTVLLRALDSRSDDSLVRGVREVNVPHDGENVRAQDLDHR